MCAEICTATCSILGLSGCIVGCLAAAGVTSAPAGLASVGVAAVSATTSSAIAS